MPKLRTNNAEKNLTKLAAYMKTFVDWFGERFDQVVDENGLTSAEYRTLAALPAGETYSETELAEVLKRDIGRTGKALKGLEAKGLVSRSSATGDKRKSLWQSSEAGSMRLQDIQQGSLYMVRRCMASGDQDRWDRTVLFLRN